MNIYAPTPQTALWLLVCIGFALLITQPLRPVFAPAPRSPLCQRFFSLCALQRRLREQEAADPRRLARVLMRPALKLGLNVSAGIIAQLQQLVFLPGIGILNAPLCNSIKPRSGLLESST